MPRRASLGALPRSGAVALLSVVLAAASCNSDTIDFGRADCARPDSDTHFFPLGALDDRRADLDSFSRAWFSKHLRATGQASLSCGQTALEGYRFLWLRTFHHPIAVLLRADKDSFDLTAVELGGAGGYDPGAPIRTVARHLSPSEAAMVRRIIGQVWATSPTDKTLVVDGAEWIVEGRNDHRYRVVDRHSPTTGKVREIGLSFLKLSGFTPSGGDTDPIY
jgi:hypothetical protein